MQTVSVERIVAAPIGDVFRWLSEAGNYTDAWVVVRERLVQQGDGAAYGEGAVRQLTWVFGWFRERITAYRPPHEFDYVVERSVPPVRHEGGRLTFTEVPEGTRVEWTTTVEMAVPVAAGAITRVFGRPVIAYTFRSVMDAANAALTARALERGEADLSRG